MQTKSLLQDLNLKGGCILNNKEQILDLFYNQNLKQCEIVKQLNLSKQYVSKIVKDEKNIQK